MDILTDSMPALGWNQDYMDSIALCSPPPLAIMRLFATDLAGHIEVSLSFMWIGLFYIGTNCSVWEIYHTY